MTHGVRQDSWDKFWAQSAAKSADRPRAAVAPPAGWQGIAQVQKQVWHELASKLPKGARLLDIGTGGGEVIMHLMDKRRDLKAVGVDRAKTLPSPPRGAKLRGDVDMAKLPFPDGRFAAVTGQFAFEYSDVGRTAKELKRVLQSGGTLALMTHRTDGPITGHNRKRRKEIDWALREQKLADIAKRSLGLRALGMAALPPEIIAAPELGARKFGPQSAAWEIAEAIRQTLHLGRNDSAGGVAKGIDAITDQAENELGRIASLEAAAVTTSDPALVPGALLDAGFVITAERVLVDPVSNMPFADFRILKPTS